MAMVADGFFKEWLREFDELAAAYMELKLKAISNARR
jgi:hypothetical protein